MPNALPPKQTTSHEQLSEAIAIIATAIIRASRKDHKKTKETVLPLDFTPNRSVHGAPRDNTEKQP